MPLGRPSLTSVGGAVPSASTLSTSPRRGEATALSAMAGQFMTQMQQMAANQHRLMEMMLGGVPASGGGRPMRSLSALEDRREVARETRLTAHSDGIRLAEKGDHRAAGWTAEGLDRGWHVPGADRSQKSARPFTINS